MLPSLHGAVFGFAMVMLAVEGRSFVQTPDIAKLYRQLLGKSKLSESNTRHMSMDEVDKLSSAFLIHGKPIGTQLSSAPLGEPFHWESCGPANQSIEVRSLTIKPSPLSFPGPITFGFDIIFHDTISSSEEVKAALKLEINTEGTWIGIPCIGNIGSCTYDDLCLLLKKIQCPTDLTKQGITCSCPFNKGEYKLPKYSVQVDAAVFLAGEYRAQAVLTDPKKRQIACYKIAFTVE